MKAQKMSQTPKTSIMAETRRRILLGVFTLIPLWLTFLLLSIILQFISDMAAPLINWLTSGINASDMAYRFSRAPAFQTALSLFVMVTILYLTGWLASRWLGRKIMVLVDDIMQRIPIARSIYKTIKRLAEAIQTTSNDFERVVLIEFPSRDMKTVGLVTRTFKDTNTGRELAAVYVPTTPNPTSGYLEIVPVEYLTPTDWKMEEAMSFIISGGADVPKTFFYDKPPTSKLTP